jgi:hypothetical protein
MLKSLLAVLIGLATFVLPEAACAGDLVNEIKIGVLAHDVPLLWSHFRAEPASADINIEVLFAPSIALFGGTLRPAAGGTINMVGATSHGYIDARWQYETASRVFFGLGLGVAVHNGQLQLEDWDRKALGSRVLFHFPIEVGYRLDDHNSVSAYFEHTSNAYTVSPNEGLDRIGVRYGYRF